MPNFRKKPVEIEAFPVQDAIDCAAHDWRALPPWLRDAYEGRNTAGVKTIVFTPTEVHISTLEGVMVGQIGDWIIRGVQGELYPCKPDIFEATYDPVP